MSERKPSVLIADILQCISRIGDYTKGLTFDTFGGNFLIVEACLYNLQIIGEAASKLPEDVKSNEKNIPWALIKGMRNRLIHEYFGTDTEIVWKVITNELPEMVSELDKIYLQLSKKNS